MRYAFVFVVAGEVSSVGLTPAKKRQPRKMVFGGYGFSLDMNAPGMFTGSGHESGKGQDGSKRDDDA